MKHTSRALSTLVIILSIVLAACGGGGQPAAGNDGNPGETGPMLESAPINVVSILNGNLGDRSFFDSAEAGLQELEAMGIITYRTLQLGGTDADQPRWRDTLIEVSDSGEFDVVIVGTWQMNEFLEEIAPQFPDQMYIIYDSVVNLPNVLSLNYRQNDMGFIIGAFAAAMTTETDFPNINPDPVIGFVGGEDGPVINDFLVGFIEGALSVNPDIRVDTRYVASFVDPAGARELAHAMIIQNNVDIIWGVAGLSGNGAAEAAFENNAWFIGVDSDQEATFVGAQAALADVTLTSGLKNVGESLIWAFTELDAGRTHWGQEIWLGLDMNGVGIVTDKNFATTPAHVQELTLRALADVESGAVTVGSAFGENAVDVAALRESVRP
ncbi:MAG: BMP family ABC transporter substrate-binding protein [Oscillospiraceae bacterium]|nr:BMP family ABC transporter substrate-binding protein [Oscillospiraceae bacterium]